MGIEEYPYSSSSSPENTSDQREYIVRVSTFMYVNINNIC